MLNEFVPRVRSWRYVLFLSAVAIIAACSEPVDLTGTGQIAEPPPPPPPPAQLPTAATIVLDHAELWLPGGGLGYAFLSASVYDTNGTQILHPLVMFKSSDGLVVDFAHDDFCMPCGGHSTPWTPSGGYASLLGHGAGTATVTATVLPITGRYATPEEQVVATTLVTIVY